ncbi:AAA family ATPase, partial [Candidatus Albibeggiatoa sp. nov. BB20]|uniref:AAA family ATPase n=1 Tax=Candidatus Albibeggiatoa sp. nov. BB20 TaxID=3162723 RepID=UPI00336532AE
SNTSSLYRTAPKLSINAAFQIDSTTQKTTLNSRALPNQIKAIGVNRLFDYKQLQGLTRENIGDARILQERQKLVNAVDGNITTDIKQWITNRYFIVEKDWAKIERENWNQVVKSLPKLAPKDTELEFLYVKRDFEPVFKLNGKECYLDELSSGFKSFLVIIFSIVDWCEGIYEDENALLENVQGTVLIDEIDAHLHPKWQMTIIRTLKDLFPKLQFIVTTHSPHVIASAEANEIIRIPQHNGTVELKPDAQSYQGWQLDFILQDVMNMSNLFQADVQTSLENLNKAYDDNDLESYDKYLDELEHCLHPNDSILKVYQLKKSNLLLTQP